MINEVSERLKNLRKSTGLSQSELADKLNVHLQTISKWERGISEPDIAQMGELAAVLGVSLEKLFGVEEGEQTFAGNFSAEKLGEYISDLRVRQNESQQQLAEICFSSADAVSRWERGVTCPDINSLKILAEHFNVPISKLYYAVSDEVVTPTVVSGRKNRKTVAVLASALAAVTAAAATFITVLLVNRPNAEQAVPVIVTVDGVEQTINQNDWFMPQAENRTGYDFIGWQNALGEEITVPYKVTGNCEFISVYVPHEYNIDYWVNGGTFTSSLVPDTFTVESGELTLPVPQKAGASFEGWYFERDYSGSALTQISCRAENVSLYAKWSDETYTVRYELGGGIMYEDNPVTLSREKEMELYSPLRKGYLFLGWYDSLENGTLYKSVGGTNARNVTLYAVWQKYDAAFEILYELNGGVLSEANPSSVGAGEIHLLNSPAKTGCEFIGWNDKADGTGKFYGELRGVQENLSLYAIWRETDVGDKQEGFVYEKNLTESTVTIMGYRGPFGENVDLVIPAEIEGLPVVAIEGMRYDTEEYDFQRLRSLSIPEGIVRLGDYAFKNFSISLPVTIPASVEEIGEECFYGCQFGELYFAEGSKLKTIGTSVFANTYTNNVLHLPSQLEELGYQAFYMASMAGIILPDSLKRIYTGALLLEPYNPYYGDYGMNTQVPGGYNVYLPGGIEYIASRSVACYSWGTIYAAFTEDWAKRFAPQWNCRDNGGAETVVYGVQSVQVRLHDDEKETELSGNAFSLPVPEKDGYTFIGWRIQSEDRYVNQYLVAWEDCELHAVYEPIGAHDGRALERIANLKSDVVYEFDIRGGTDFYFKPDDSNAKNIIVNFALDMGNEETSEYKLVQIYYYENGEFKEALDSGRKVTVSPQDYFKVGLACFPVVLHVQVWITVLN